MICTLHVLDCNPSSAVDKLSHCTLQVLRLTYKRLPIPPRRNLCTHEGHTIFHIRPILIYIPHQKLLCVSTAIVSTAIRAVYCVGKDLHFTCPGAVKRAITPRLALCDTYACLLIPSPRIGFYVFSFTAWGPENRTPHLCFIRTLL